MIGPSIAPAPVRSLVEALELRAASDRPWLWFQHGSLTGSGAWRLARGWAASFAAAGVTAGDRVALILPNSAELVGAFFGAQLLGAVPVPLPWPVLAGDPEAVLRSVSSLVRASTARALAVPTGIAAASRFGLPLVTGPSTPIADRVDLDPDAPAFVQFTSGSGGVPRGAVISHGAAVANAWAIGEALDAREDDVGVSWLPLFHDMGLIGVLLSSLVRGFAVHIMTPAGFLLHPRRWLEKISDARATLTVAPNFGYELVSRRCEPAASTDLSRLRACLSGSEPVLRSTIDAFEARFATAGLRAGTILPVYGLAEATLGVTFASAPASAPDLTWNGRSIPSVGAPIGNVQVDVVIDGDRPAPDGTEGEIVVRGPSLMSGYLHDREATAAALRGGWLHTGDLGVIDGGRLYVTGREKELIIKGGRKLHPIEIERIVADVIDAPQSGVAAFSRTNGATGTEDLVVVAELRRGEPEAAERRVRGRLAEELGVRADRIRFVAAGTLPRTTSGKLRRGACVSLIEDDG